MLRAGSAGSNTAADHIEASRLALAQLPRHLRRKVLIRADSGGGTHGFLHWLTAKSRRLHYSVGMTVTEDNAERDPQGPGGFLDAGLRRRRAGQGRGVGRRHHRDARSFLLAGPGCGSSSVRNARTLGAQLRFTDIDGHRFTAFATDAKKGQLADLELRHRPPPGPLRQGHRAAQPARSLSSARRLLTFLTCGFASWTVLFTGARPRRERRRGVFSTACSPGASRLA